MHLMALNYMLFFIYLTNFYVVLCGNLYPIHMCRPASLVGIAGNFF